MIASLGAAWSWVTGAFKGVPEWLWITAAGAFGIWAFRRDARKDGEREQELKATKQDVKRREKIDEAEAVVIREHDSGRLHELTRDDPNNLGRPKRVR